LNLRISDNLEIFRDNFYKGYVLAHPTETVYGLAVNSFNKDAISLLSSLKKGRTSPYILLIKDFEMLEKYAEISSYKNFISSLWPAPVSLVLKTKSNLPEWLKDTKGNACFRISSARFLKELFTKYIDLPIISTSANPHTYPVARDPIEVLSFFPQEERITVFPDIYNDLNKNIPSTILDLSTDKPRILRKGPINIVF
jgi:L-threonylcarbamoyladenylate synthase